MPAVGKFLSLLNGPVLRRAGNRYGPAITVALKNSKTQTAVRMEQVEKKCRYLRLIEWMHTSATTTLATTVRLSDETSLAGCPGTVAGAGSEAVTTYRRYRRYQREAPGEHPGKFDWRGAEVPSSSLRFSVEARRQATDPTFLRSDYQHSGGGGNLAKCPEADRRQGLCRSARAAAAFLSGRNARKRCQSGDGLRRYGKELVSGLP
jgi:hypothetical protein